MKLKAVYLIILLTTPALHAQENLSCAQACPNGRKEITVCFKDAVTKDNWTERTTVENTCGAEAKSFYAGRIEDVQQVLKNISTTCDSIKVLKFVGHAAPGFHGAGLLSTKNAESLSPYSCVMAKKAKIDLTGCNTGRGCMGQMFMWAVAKALLPRGGSVSGTSFYALGSPVMNIWSPAGSRELRYNPQNTPPDRWSYTYAAGLRGKHSPMASCKAEYEDALAVYDHHVKMAALTKCPVSGVTNADADLIRIVSRNLGELEKEQKSFAPIFGQIEGARLHTGVSEQSSRLTQAARKLAECNARYRTFRPAVSENFESPTAR